MIACLPWRRDIEWEDVVRFSKHLGQREGTGYKRIDGDDGSDKSDDPGDRTECALYRLLVTGGTFLCLYPLSHPSLAMLLIIRRAASLCLTEAVSIIILYCTGHSYRRIHESPGKTPIHRRAELNENTPYRCDISEQFDLKRESITSAC
jgi:hypothetical protein